MVRVPHQGNRRGQRSPETRRGKVFPSPQTLRMANGGRPHRLTCRMMCSAPRLRRLWQSPRTRRRKRLVCITSHCFLQLKVTIIITNFNWNRSIYLYLFLMLLMSKWIFILCFCFLFFRLIEPSPLNFTTDCFCLYIYIYIFFFFIIVVIFVLY